MSNFYGECAIFAEQTKNNIHMKELIDILMSEDKSFEGLPKWVWIVAAPAALVLMCMIGGTLS